MTTALLSEVGRGEEASGLTIPALPLSPEEVGARIARAREEKKPKPWSQFDLAADNTDRIQHDGGDSSVSQAYMNAAHNRMQAIGCYG